MSKRAPSRPPAKGRKPAAKRPPQQRRRQGPGAIDRAVSALGLSHDAIRRITAWGLVGLAGAGAIGVASWFGVPAMAGQAVSEAIGDAGLRLNAIEITGLRRMDRDTVYAQALDQKSRAMPLIDLAGVRERLLRYPWIEDARVSRRLPDTLVIHIVEREPAAIWQHHQGQLTLIDVKGFPIAPVSRDAMPNLPLLIGDTANTQELARRRLLDAAPSLKPLVKAAAWVGNRRWDLFFDTGEKLQLPEGEAAAVAALTRFAKRDADFRVLGRGVISFDMRNEGQFVIRMPRAQPAPSPSPSQAAQAREDAPEREGDIAKSGE
ncbi:cell division protein FtsQ/DivIB [Sphingomonas canadensis]|uniref:Cell division protein FtsQ n=1 Tax=Sphingomonas canadensis TaxID=1219257 RepID=A0ABW3H2L8_9SPHN|nr:FtsQ-type POTRA domain-containing protein [Sphingomonas canadensis]MCW3835827.1 FtsQ-type POTRA domain-containing protein [Sphingomonas canadensis]